MKIAGICFTKSGSVLAEKIQKILDDHYRDTDFVTVWYAKSRFSDVRKDFFRILEQPIQEWAGDHFRDCDGLIFIGAAGIAVRAIAPHVRDKRTDPAVIVLDEKGKFCISLLSGHIGGANEMVRVISKDLGSIPVITTATDINNRFAVDVYAKENQMTISNMTYAKEVSAALLSGEPVGFYTNFEVEGDLPKGICWSDKLPEEQADTGEARQQDGTDLGIYISPSYQRAYFKHTLWLIPRCLVLGIGCKKGTDVSAIRGLVADVLREYSLYQEAVLEVATIDIKKDEPGLVRYCREIGVPLRTFTADELNQIPGTFNGSDFVKQTTGVDSVCERSAVADGGHLIVSKTARDGVTLAVALLSRKIQF